MKTTVSADEEEVCAPILRTLGASLLVVVVTLSVLVIYYPLDDDVALETATLTSLVNTDRNVAGINLTVNITVRNPNKRQVLLSYPRFESEAYYSGISLGSFAVPNFKLGHEETTVMSAAFWAQSCYDCVGPFKLADSTKRLFDVDFVLRRTIHHESWGWDTWYTFKCKLAFRFVLNGTVNTDLTDVGCYDLPLRRRMQF